MESENATNERNHRGCILLLSNPLYTVVTLRPYYYIEEENIVISLIFIKIIYLKVCELSLKTKFEV